MRSEMGDRFAATCSHASHEAPLRGLRPTGFDQAHGVGVTIGFTGAQFGCEEAGQMRALEMLLRELRDGGCVWMQNGDCIGSDAKAARLWVKLGGHLYLRPPKNSSRRAFLKADIETEPREYLERNRDIVDHSRLLVATPQEMHEQLRSGTWSTVRYARKRGRPIAIVWRDGTITRENWPASVDTHPEGHDREAGHGS